MKDWPEREERARRKARSRGKGQGARGKGARGEGRGVRDERRGARGGEGIGHCRMFYL
jgi:hypothetical protein